MQIILSPASGDNWLLTVESNTPVAEVRRQVADKQGIDAKVVKLVCEGLELEDGLTLGELFVANLSTVKVVIVAPATPLSTPAAEAALAAAPAPESAAGAGAEAGASESLITDDEALRTIIVSNIPSADPITTERTLVKVYAKFGAIQSIMTQDEQSVHDTSAQRAVIVFQNQNSAAQALSTDGTFIMPTSTFKEVKVVLASNLALRDAATAGGAGGEAAAAGAGAPRFFNPSGSNAVSRLLASGYVAGENGVASVKRFTNEKAPGVSSSIEKVKVSVYEFNQKYKITPWLEQTWHQGVASLQDIDKELKVSEKFKHGASYALMQASSWTRAAMQNPTIASTVTSAHTFLKEAGQALSGTLESANKEANAKRQSIIAAQAAAAEGNVAVGVPVAAPAADGSVPAAIPVDGAAAKPALASPGPAVTSEGAPATTNPSPASVVTTNPVKGAPGIL